MWLWRSLPLQVLHLRPKAAAWLFHLVKDRLSFIGKMPPRSSVAKGFQPHFRQLFLFDTGRPIVENPAMGSILPEPACFYIPCLVKYSFLNRGSFPGGCCVGGWNRCRACLSWPPVLPLSFLLWWRHTAIREQINRIQAYCHSHTSPNQ